MRWVYAFVRLYPFFAVPVALILVELGLHFRRRRVKTQFYFFGIAGFLLLTSFLWLFYRGDSRSDHWVRWFIT